MLALEVFRTQPNTLLLTPGFRGGAYAGHWAAWADFNRDGRFDPGERIVSTRSNSAVLTTFEVPQGSEAGSVMVRIAMRFDAAPEACGEFHYGEVEDVVINLH